jgi:hypothetical protein
MRPNTLAGLDSAEAARRLAGPGLALDFGAARVRVQSDVAELVPLLQLLYATLPVLEPAGCFDATVALMRVGGLRRWFNPQIQCVTDGVQPFAPFPADTHLPYLEWGMNHALATRVFHHLLLHAGVVARSDHRAVILPAVPGSGKSTLTAALTLSGYRLLSDEFGVIDPRTGRLLPMVRPIALKNASVPVIRERGAGAVLGPVFPKTRKGDVAHLAPDAASVAARHVPATPALVVFPRFIAGQPASLTPVDPGSAMTRLAVNSFNYEFLGLQAFEQVAGLATTLPCRQLVFGDLDAAIALIDEALDEAPAPEAAGAVDASAEADA